MTKGTLLAIAFHRAPRAPIQTLDEVRVTTVSGIEGDCHGQPGGGQVAVLTEEGWRAALAEIKADLLWTIRRANLLVSGLDLENAAGATLEIGDVVMEITEELAPCWLMDKQHRGLRRALAPNWRAGVACRVLRDGTVRVGDAVKLNPGLS